MEHRRILVVDDSVDDIFLLVDQIEELDLQVTIEFAMTAEEGLLKIRKKDYALVLCDFRLPGVTGVAFMNVSMDIRPDTPVVLLTGYRADELTQDTAAKQPYVLLHKPLENRVLRRIITDALVYRKWRAA
jgi:CheY-like chemotaxis protein